MGVLTLNGRALMVGGAALSIATGYKCIQFCNISTTCPNNNALTECTCACLNSYDSMAVGESYSICMNYSLFKSVSDSPYTEITEVKCNNTVIRCCAISTQLSASASGSFTPFTVAYGDTVHITTYADIDTELNGGAMALLYITGITPIVGNFCIGEPSDVISTTCAM